MQDWVNGPARLCQAPESNGRMNGPDRTDPRMHLVIEAMRPVTEEKVIVGPGIRIDGMPEAWRSMPWWYRVAEEGGRDAILGS